MHTCAHTQSSRHESPALCHSHQRWGLCLGPADHSYFLVKCLLRCSTQSGLWVQQCPSRKANSYLEPTPPERAVTHPHWDGHRLSSRSQTAGGIPLRSPRTYSSSWAITGLPCYETLGISPPIRVLKGSLHGPTQLLCGAMSGVDGSKEGICQIAPKTQL